ncbi:hypothetical protein [Kutzneria sp. NPDC051319]|uniref:hypothetical protein n=1 Tax=Kutzneria sp. NPDC051319 TaxID=3155047 RepID=UPI00342D5019
MPTKRGLLPVLAAVIRILTWLAGLTALVAVIAAAGEFGWLPTTTAGPTCVDTGARLACTDHPSLIQRLADAGDQLPSLLFSLGALWLLLRFLRTAAQDGPYAGAVPGRLAAFGWFTLIGGPVSSALEALARTSLLGSLAPDAATSNWIDRWLSNFPDWSVVAGVAALTFAHILRIGVGMREDLEGTV